MSEYIKKSEVLSEIIDANMHDYFASYYNYSKFYDRIKDMSSVSSNKLNEDKWISTKDRLPEEKQVVLIIANGESECGLYYTVSLILNNNWFCKDDVLYWQPLPKLPKELRDK